MNRIDFHKMFKAPGPVVLPVIHVLDTLQTTHNVKIVIGEGAAGVFLINHDFEKEKLVPVIEDIRLAFPSLWLGVNFLAVTGRDAFPILGELEGSGCVVDGYWGDDARIDERRSRDHQPEAEEIDKVRSSSGWSGLYFGGTAFKKQRPVDPADYRKSATIACKHMDVVTTSGIATGHEADHSKISDFRSGCGDTVIALASGVTPANATDYADVDCFMVATGISPEGDFYNIDPAKLRDLMRITRQMGGGTND